MPNLQPWQVCTGLMCWPMLFIGAWVLYQALSNPAGGNSETEQYQYRSGKVPEGHADFEVMHAAALAQERHYGRNRGADVYVQYSDVTHESRVAGAWLEQHGREVGVHPVKTTTESVDSNYRNG